MMSIIRPSPQDIRRYLHNLQNLRRDPAAAVAQVQRRELFIFLGSFAALAGLAVFYQQLHEFLRLLLMAIGIFLASIAWVLRTRIKEAPITLQVIDWNKVDMLLLEHDEGREPVEGTPEHLER